MGLDFSLFGATTRTAPTPIAFGDGAGHSAKAGPDFRARAHTWPIIARSATGKKAPRVSRGRGRTGDWSSYAQRRGEDAVRLFRARARSRDPSSYAERRGEGALRMFGSSIDEQRFISLARTHSSPVFKRTELAIAI
jgi:hypothetical protein